MSESSADGIDQDELLLRGAGSTEEALHHLRRGDDNVVFFTLMHLTEDQCAEPAVRAELEHLLHAADRNVRFMAIGQYTGCRYQSDDAEFLRYLLEMLRPSGDWHAIETAYLALLQVSTRFSQSHCIKWLLEPKHQRRDLIDWALIESLREELEPPAGSG